MISDLRDCYQQRCRIHVASTEEKLGAGMDDLWDSGVLEHAGCTPVEYAGRPLTSRERCWWKADVWDNHGRSASSTEPAWFEMGLLEPQDWKGNWVGHNGGWVDRSLQFRRRFQLPHDKPIVRARAYFSGLGYGELYLNGVKVGHRVLDPAWTAYQKRVLYATDDVTDRLRPGPNIVGVLLGHGWLGDRKFLLQLEVKYADAKVERVLGGWDWDVTASPIVSDSIYDGEQYDARLEIPGWTDPLAPPAEPRPRPCGWQHAMVAEAPAGRVTAAVLEPIRVIETFRPTSCSQVMPGIWVFDAGHNLAGWCRIRVKGNAGTRIELRFAENVNADGTVNQANLRQAQALDSYTLKGEGVEQWEPRFTYHGFRYVQVEGWPGQPSTADIDVRVVRSSVAQRGAFSCDDPLINQIQTAVARTEASNLHGIPTDCPQRDERFGWLNDLTARAEESIYNFELFCFYQKWLNDISDAQDPSGAIPDTVPYRWGNQPADPVCIGYLLLPWLLYQHYGDPHPMRQHYPGMRAWVESLLAEAPDGVLKRSYYGDWAPPIYRKGLSTPPEDTAHNRDTPGELVSTGFLAFACRLLSQIAIALGDQAEATIYTKHADAIAGSFHERYWNAELGGYGSSNQSCNALALYLNLAPQDKRAAVVDALVHNVQMIQGGHLATGNICTKYLLEALTDAGRSDVAFTIATQRSYPSWGYMLANGATTLWERWEHTTGGGMNSHNHPMLGSVSAWFYRALAGMRFEVPNERGLRLSIRPSLVAGLSRAQATLQTAAGPVAVVWQRDGNDLDVKLEVSPNATADVSLPQRIGEAEAQRLWADNDVAWSSGPNQYEPLGWLPVQSSGQDLRCSLGSGHYQLQLEYQNK